MKRSISLAEFKILLSIWNSDRSTRIHVAYFSLIEEIYQDAKMLFFSVTASVSRSIRSYSNAQITLEKKGERSAGDRQNDELWLE